MKKIIVTICITVIIITSAIAFVGCDKKTEELPGRDDYDDYIGSLSFCDVHTKTNLSAFDLDDDDVKKSFTFGRGEPCPVSYKILGTYFMSGDGNSTAPEIEYCIEILDEEIPIWGSFSHEREYFIPKHLFQYEMGVIVFQVRGVFIFPEDEDNEHHPYPGCYLVPGYEEEGILNMATLELWYKIKGNTVILGSQYVISSLV